MDRTDENVKKYAVFICSLCEHHKLRHLDTSAMARVIEYSSRLAEDRKKLTTRFAFVADIIREGNYYAGLDNAPLITGNYIEKAIDEKFYRSNLVQEKIREYIERGIFLIDTEGETVGQVNGLSVMSLGDFEFGRPSRVTASSSAVVFMDIERGKSFWSLTQRGDDPSGYIKLKYDAKSRAVSLQGCI